MLETVKKRIEELEQVATDEDFDRFEQRGQSRPQTMLTMAALEKKYGKAEDDEAKGNDETRSVAMSALNENKELGNIHSRKSVAALAATAVAKNASPAPFALHSVRVTRAAAAMLPRTPFPF